MRNKPKRLTKQNFLVVFLLLSPVSHSDTTEQLMTDCIQNVLEGIPSPFEKTITTPIGNERLQKLAHALKVLNRHLEAAVNDQGFHLGFNSRDGDS